MTAKSLPNTLQDGTAPCYYITVQRPRCKIPLGYLSNSFIQQETFANVLASTE